MLPFGHMRDPGGVNLQAVKMSFLHQNFWLRTASLSWALFMFSSILLMGISRFHLKLRMALVSSTTKQQTAAFSKSEICSSQGLGRQDLVGR